ncbi:MAG: hypothetical protein Q9M40_05040 [Sulfurimonas sp.]|nr:hypothetical protein [Sulfurimonas sp.]MDQ7061216.1 hypothetical protein [Sulfurimonas sp.]MDQ7067377.1 hypothetical protein [Sulfurimonas sp.]
MYTKEEMKIVEYVETQNPKSIENVRGEINKIKSIILKNIQKKKSSK